MEDAFNKLKQQGKTDVESLIQWMKDAKIIEDAKSAEDKVRHLLKDSADKSSVEFSKFMEALGKVAEEQAKIKNHEQAFWDFDIFDNNEVYT